jgi:hypothetical protein
MLNVLAWLGAVRDRTRYDWARDKPIREHNLQIGSKLIKNGAGNRGIDYGVPSSKSSR